MVPFRVGCPRCDHDLRDLQQPHCPQCSLDFDWADVLPLQELTCPTCDYHLYGLREPRCPECGHAFDWQRVLSGHHARRLPLFEYHYQRSFFGSAWRTWRAVWRPGRLWRKLELHYTPRARALVVLALICWFAMVFVLVVVEGLAQWRTSMIWWGLYSPRAAVTTGNSWRVFRQIAESQLSDVGLYFSVFLVYAASSLAALLLFVQSMARHRIRPGHIVRIWVYALMVPIPTLIGLMFVLMWLTLEVPNQMGIIGPTWPSALTFQDIGRMHRILIHISGVLSIAFLCHAIACGYRYYLRIRHALLIAISSQLIALMVTALGADWIFEANVGTMTILRSARSFGLPV